MAALGLASSRQEPISFELLRQTVLQPKATSQCSWKFQRLKVVGHGKSSSFVGYVNHGRNNHDFHRDVYSRLARNWWIPDATRLLARSIRITN